MGEGIGIGEFEQLVLMAILGLGSEARAAAIRARIEEGARRDVSRGALYVTLDRLVSKGFVNWKPEVRGPARGGIPGRRFAVTAQGVAALRRSWRAVNAMAKGLENHLGKA